MRDGFILHEKTMAQIDRLSNEQAGEFLKAMIAHYKGEDQEDVSQIVDVLMIDASERMDRDREVYEEQTQKRSEAGRKGADKRWHDDGNDMANDGNAMANDGKAIANDSNDMANDSLSVSVSDSVLKETSPTESKRKVFVRPTVDEVLAYCIERGNHVDAEAFVAFYDSKGWKVGNAPMKSWKAAVVTWEKRQKQNAPPKAQPANKFQNFPINEDNRALAARIIAMK